MSFIIFSINFKFHYTTVFVDEYAFAVGFVRALGPLTPILAFQRTNHHLGTVLKIPLSKLRVAQVAANTHEIVKCGIILQTCD